MFNNDDWLSQLEEEVIDPEREIVDPHHHLWPQPEMHYNLAEFLTDLGCGHRIVETVFMECGAAYTADGPEHLRPVGETAFVAAAADQAEAQGASTRISGIVAHADLMGPHLDEVLDAHEAASGGRFRGIRHSGARDDDAALRIKGRGIEGQYEREDFQRGVARLGERGLTYDTWHYHHQNRAFLQLAQAVPETTLVLDHFGTPLGVGAYAGKREEIFEVWKEDVAALAECPNVVAKLGGLAMPDNGWGWHEAERPPTSDAFIEAQGRYYHHMIDCFGAERCMFESNFPVDRWSIGYGVLWNGLKKIAANYSDADQDAMFSGTARRIYRL